MTSRCNSPPGVADAVVNISTRAWCVLSCPGVSWCRSRCCLRVELGNVSAGRQRDGVARMRKLAEEGEGGWVRATERSEWRGHKRVASSFDGVTVFTRGIVSKKYR